MYRIKNIYETFTVTVVNMNRTIKKLAFNVLLLLCLCQNLISGKSQLYFLSHFLSIKESIFCIKIQSIARRFICQHIIVFYKTTLCTTVSNSSMETAGRCLEYHKHTEKYLASFDEQKLNSHFTGTSQYCLSNCRFG